MINLDIDIPDILLPGIGDRVQDAIDEALNTWIEDLPYEITRLLRQGQRPDGSSQPANVESTLKAKQRKGQGSTPGVATGEMSTARNWRVTHSRRGTILRPPKGRKDIQDFLEGRGYDFVGIPDTMLRKLEEMMQAAVDRVFDQ